MSIPKDKEKDDAYARIRAYQETPRMTLEANSESEFGAAIMDLLFIKESGHIRKNIDPLPAIHVEFEGKRYRFKIGYDTRIDYDREVFRFTVECYGGIPDDNPI